MLGRSLLLLLLLELKILKLLLGLFQAGLLLLWLDGRRLHLVTVGWRGMAHTSAAAAVVADGLRGNFVRLGLMIVVRFVAGSLGGV